jgi:radical SAM superfamily enzyme YgiQ (UPF0313 family)
MTPQAIALWCRQLGHEVYYATYYGQQDPRSLLPDALDVIFIATCTQASPIAYSLAKIFRREKTLTVIGGAHARSFPADCLRFFDIVVQDCDKAMIDEILKGSYDRGTLATSGRRLEKMPSVEERLPEISIAHFKRGQPTALSWITLLASLGCPYKCDFCIDWDKPYVLFPPERLAADLQFISKHFPGIFVQYHDPNFGVKFDQIMEILMQIPKTNRNPYIMGCSLSILNRKRMQKLKETNCAFTLIGLESWANYSNKAGLGSIEGQKKLEKIVVHLRELYHYVKSLQVTLLFGTDVDRGDEPVELTKKLIRILPSIWPVVNIPIPFGGTPLFERYLAEDRILKSMPFSFYCTPYLTTTLANYNPLKYYEKWVEINKVAISGKLLVRRISTSKNQLQKLAHLIRSFAVWEQFFQMRRIRNLLRTDSKFRAFHEGRSNRLPEYYRRIYKKRLGSYAELITEAEMTPEIET